jgi:hypothetical protein
MSDSRRIVLHEIHKKRGAVMKSNRNGSQWLCGTAMLALIFGIEDSAVADVSPPAEGTVNLTFHWDDLKRTSVVVLRQTGSTGEMNSAVQFQYDVQIARNDFYDLTVTDLNTVTELGSVRVLPEEENQVALGGLILDYKIGRNGGFEGIHHFEDRQARVKQMYRNRFGGAKDVEKADRIIAAAIQPATLQSEALRTWGALVGSWTGKTMIIGKPLVERLMTTMPFSGEPIRMIVDRSFVGWTECIQGELQKKCVLLRSVGRPDPQSLVNAISRLSIANGGPDARGLKASVEFNVELVTEPDTLKPHRAQWSRESNVSDAANQQPRTQKDVVDMRFSYP